MNTHSILKIFSYRYMYIMEKILSSNKENFLLSVYVDLNEIYSIRIFESSLFVLKDRNYLQISPTVSEILYFDLGHHIVLPAQFLKDILIYDETQMVLTYGRYSEHIPHLFITSLIKRRFNIINGIIEKYKGSNNVQF